jgi:hypothetical protein
MKLLAVLIQARHQQLLSLDLLIIHHSLLIVKNFYKLLFVCFFLELKQ